MLPPYSALPEPLLSFSSGRVGATDANPLRGLINHGPYSRLAIPAYTPVIRIATVGPRSGAASVKELVQSLNVSHDPNDRADYVPKYQGFSSVFGTELALAHQPAAHITWPDNLGDFGRAGSPSQQMAGALDAAVSQLAAVRADFDVAIIQLPELWRDACRSITFDAHDHLKATAALASIPTQVVNDRLFSFRLVASRSWRLGIALYAKAGGIPWKLAPLPGIPPSTAYIGLAYAMRGDPREAKFVTCCSQVFDADGGGMQFVAYDATDPMEDSDAARSNPYLSRSDMRAVLARSLRTYQSRNGGSIPKRVVVHKLTGFRDDELDGVDEALSAVNEVECIEITTNVAWRGVWLREPRPPASKGRPDGYPVPRGTMLLLSGTSALLWGAGNTPGVSTKGNFYQGQKSIPRPLILRRYAGSGPLEVASLEALALTKMDWNNDALYDPVPVTIQYSRRLARTIANAPFLPNGEYPYRMFM